MSFIEVSKTGPENIGCQLVLKWKAKQENKVNRQHESSILISFFNMKISKKYFF